MTFDEVLAQMVELLQREGRVTYRALKRRFALDDDYLEDLKGELIKAKRLAVDEDGEVLVWVGASVRQETENRGNGESGKKDLAPPDPLPLTPHVSRAEGERRQLTVQFIDLVGSTALSEQLDPEELREVVRLYQKTCTAVIQRYAGHVAQHLGDGLLVYFGYPTAHEDDAARAVRAGLEIITALAKQVPSPLRGEGQGEGEIPSPLQDTPHLSPLPQGAMGLHVRIGIHTGLVVIGEIGSSAKREMLALGETPNVAARVQGVAEPDTVVMSATTHRLVQGLFEYQDLGPQTLKGISTPLSLYRVIGESAAQSRFEVAVGIGLTPLVGREGELSVLQRRWTQAKDGAGQVVLLSGEPGIGKSRLVQELKEHVSAEGATRIEFRCSPYHQNSALYPIIDHLQRLLQFAREDTPEEKLKKLEVGARRAVPLQREAIPLLAVLLSLPHPAGYPPITVSSQKQKEKTQEALVAWIVEEAEKAPVYCAWEDLHWADPSTLEVLTLLLDQAPTTRLLALLTFRPEFSPPWGNRSHLSQLTLSRLGRNQVETMVEQVARGAALPAEVVQQIVVKTDGVPLFIEELTKSVVESVGATGRSPLQPLDIPATLQDSLMARLDRLNTAKEIAQLGATIGREFRYELVLAVSSLDEGSLQHGLKQLVEAELLYQRGLPPQVTYLFKHALVQDTAYQSLLKSRRQQLHQQVARVLAEQFPETVETQPELVAHHYTEAGLKEQAIPYWQRAGQRAAQRSAHVEAIRHFTKGLEVLKVLPHTPEWVQQELTLQLAQNDALVVVKGYTASEVEKNVLRARELCQQLGETPQLFPMLFRLWVFYLMRRELQTARELAEQLMRLAQSVQDRYLLLMAHAALGVTSYWRGELTSARPHLEQAIVLYDPQNHHRFSVGTTDPRVDCLSYAAWTLWFLGYPEQALKRSREAVALAKGLSHPFSLAYALICAALFHLSRREGQIAREQAEAVMALSTEQGFPFWLPQGTIAQGRALVEQGQVEEGIAQMRQGLAAYRAMGAETERIGFLLWLAAGHAQAGQVEEGLSALVEVLAFVDKTGVRYYEAELYRLKGELTLQQWKVESQKSKVKEQEAEECFLKAIEIAQRQQAKSLELRAAVSLARLWQRQGKHNAARTMLSEIYNWFTEGFDTKDLQEAKALIEELSH
jgi:predicted ATPase/class 3 adenylate cyclase